MQVNVANLGHHPPSNLRKMRKHRSLPAAHPAAPQAASISSWVSHKMGDAAELVLVEEVINGACKSVVGLEREHEERDDDGESGG